MWQQNQYEANFIVPRICKVLEEDKSFPNVYSLTIFHILSLIVPGCVVCSLLLGAHQPFNITPDTHV